MEKKIQNLFLLLFSFIIIQIAHYEGIGQSLKLPEGGTNHKSKSGRTVGITDIEINWNAPAVKGREGKIWGTEIAPYDFTVLGFGSNMPSPWRAGANECTTISFTTDVTINGKKLAAGKYALFMALYPDSTTLIFNKNVLEWGSYFYDKDLDVMRVTTRQQKTQPKSKERLEYTFEKQTDKSVEIALEWEFWRIPFMVEVDLLNTTMASINSQMAGGMGFEPLSLASAASWCLSNNINIEQGLDWIIRATDPNLGGLATFNVLSTKAGLLNKLGKKADADAAMKAAFEVATTIELHGYGRKLLSEKKIDEAFAIFEKNYTKFAGAWPTTAGMMRAYSAKGDIKKALEFAKKALAQAPDETNKRYLADLIKTLETGRGI